MYIAFGIEFLKAIPYSTRVYSEININNENALHVEQQ